MSARIVVAVGLLLMIIGAAVTALPDDDDRLFSFSQDHGPSRLDAVGIVLLLAGWALLARLVWRRRHLLTAEGAHTAAAAAVVAGGAIVLAPAIALDLGVLWLFAVAAMVAAQAYVLFRVVG